MRVYKLRAFARFQRQERIADESLAEAVRGVEGGLVDANLGGGLVKQRVARAGQGKRSGYRTIIAYRRGDRAVFLFGFAKNQKDNIEADELDRWRRIGKVYIGLDDVALNAAMAEDELIEVHYADVD